VGVGIVGLATADALQIRRPDLHIVVLEKEHAVGTHQTGHNSGVVHSGIYYRPGSLKATLCRRGAERLERFCKERGLALERCGKVIVATEEAELPALERLLDYGAANGVPGIRPIDRDELRELEPHAAGIAALHSPSTGITDFGAVTRALASDVAERAEALDPA
jgi:(S)-2-hydroxyglutarate dehydrogenase